MKTRGELTRFYEEICSLAYFSFQVRLSPFEMACRSKGINISSIFDYNIVDKSNLIGRRMGISTIGQIETNSSCRE